MKIRAIIHPAEEGGYWAEVPALPGSITEGDTIEEVMANLKDAIEGWLEVANSRNAIESTFLPTIFCQFFPPPLLPRLELELT